MVERKYPFKIQQVTARRREEIFPLEAGEPSWTSLVAEALKNSGPEDEPFMWTEGQEKKETVSGLEFAKRVRERSEEAGTDILDTLPPPNLTSK